MTDPWQDIANILDRLLPVDTVMRVREQYIRGTESVRAEYAPLVQAHREWVEAANVFHDAPCYATRRVFDDASAVLASLATTEEG